MNYDRFLRIFANNTFEIGLLRSVGGQLGGGLHEPHHPLAGLILGGGRRCSVELPLLLHLEDAALPRRPRPHLLRGDLLLGGGRRSY